LITKLSIKNFALINDVSTEFSSRLTTITGETGAGKSILLEALSLILGKRADLTSVRDVSKKCIVEAEFNLEESLFEALFKENKLDFETHTIIRRELLPTGKSRAFVNDSPVNLIQLQAVASYLVDIHSQHETLDLFSEKFQLDVIDVLAGNSILLKTYSENLKKYQEVSETISELIYKKETTSKELDYNTFLYNELLEANIGALKQEELEDKFRKLNNSEEIQESLSQINSLLSEEQIGTITTIKEARLVLGKLQNISLEFETLWNRINSVVIELEDISEEIDNVFSAIEADPKLLFEVNEKLQILYRLQEKHSVTTVSELLKLQENLAHKIEITSNLKDEIDKFETKKEKLKFLLLEISKKIHNKRKGIIPTLQQKTEAYLADLGMPNAQIKFEISSSSVFKSNGLDVLKLLFTANKGHNFEPIKKVASGGELSRIMLSIKAVLAQYKQLPTVVFDEIDSGISGEIAYKMATILKEMSLTMQMLCITHLPQIAAVGNQHIKIFKEEVDNITTTKLKKLDRGDRVKELAEMIGGKNKSVSAINQAKELLN